MKIIISIALIILLIGGFVIYDLSSKLQSNTYTNEAGELKLKGQPKAVFIGGKAFGWFVSEQLVEPNQAMTINVYSESGALQSSYRVLEKPLHGKHFNLERITFYDGESLYLDDGEKLDAVLISE